MKGREGIKGKGNERGSVKEIKGIVKESIIG